MEVSKHYIYRITNKINGKTYIGQKTMDRSLLKEDYYLVSGKLIKLAVQKYGKENFHKEIITIAMSQQEADILERLYILRERQAGKAEYNLEDGGNKGKRAIGHEPWNKGKHLSEEDKLHKSIAAKNRADGNPGAKGHKHTEEAKKAISEKNKGRVVSESVRKKISFSVSKYYKENKNGSNK